MDRKTSLIYFISFGIVFIPYVFMSFFMSRKKVDSGNAQVRNLPPIFRIIWWTMPYFSESMNRLSSLIDQKKIKKIENMLIVANLKLGINQLIGASFLLGIIFSIVAALMALCLSRSVGLIFIISMMAFVLGAIYPFNAIQNMADKRQIQIMRSLPFAIDLLCAAIRSGVDFTAAIRYYVTTEGEKNPLAVEFGVMLRQLELGKTRIEAIEDMAKRIQTDGFTSFAGAVAHSFEVGSPIVDTMKIQASEMRRIRFNIAERKAARAASSMIFPIAVFIMPAMFLIIGTPILLQVFSSGLGGIMK